MARAFSAGAMFATASFARRLCPSVSRRNYSAMSHGVEAGRSGRVGSKNPVMGKVEDRGLNLMKEESGASSAWSPDPITGYYRPEIRAAEIDAAELREMLLNHKVKP